MNSIMMLIRIKKLEDRVVQLERLLKGHDVVLKKLVANQKQISLETSPHNRVGLGEI